MQAICGTDPYPQNFRAKKWKIKDKFFTKADFQFMMRNLPVPVEEEEIEAMFEFADKDKDGKINYRQGRTSSEFHSIYHLLLWVISRFCQIFMSIGQVTQIDFNQIHIS